MSSAPAIPGKIKRRLLPVQGGLLVLLVGLLCTLFAAWQLHRHNKAILRRRLKQLTDAAAQLVRKRFEIYEYGLRGARWWRPELSVLSEKNSDNTWNRVTLRENFREQGDLALFASWRQMR